MGCEEAPHRTDPASTGGSALVDATSSTREKTPPPRIGQVPKDDDAGYLFGPGGEEDAERPESNAALAGPTVASAPKEIGRQEDALEKSGLV